VDKEKILDVDVKYLQLLGFHLDTTTTIQRGSSALPFNATSKQNFSIISYVQAGQLAASILHIQNLAAVMPAENIVIYALSLSESELQTLTIHCNSSISKCSIIHFDLSLYPSYITDERLHLYRAIIIKNALSRFRTIFFIENHIRLRGGSKAFADIRRRVEQGSVVSLLQKKLPITSNTHPRMFDYFETDADSFLFVRTVTLDAVFFHDTKFLNEKILLPWIKCVLTPHCIEPIGASSNSNHCKFNKKPQYRYVGCHGYDNSAFNVVLGLAYNFNEANYSLDNSERLLYKESLDDSIRIWEMRKKNISESSSPYSED